MHAQPKLFSRCTTNIRNCSRLLLCFSLSACLRILVRQIPFRFQFQYVGVHWYFMCIFPKQLHVGDMSCLVSIWITRDSFWYTSATSIIFHWMAMFSKEFSFCLNRFCLLMDGICLPNCVLKSGCGQTISGHYNRNKTIRTVYWYAL